MWKNLKGYLIINLFTQVFCFLFDVTSRRLTHFDALARDEGYASSIETAPEDMASSHWVECFFQAFSWPRIFLFRRLLLQLFLWRLKIATPRVIILGLEPCSWTTTTRSSAM